MRIITKDKALHVSKPEGLNVFYYLFPEYEVHYNEQPPKSAQTWHHHEKITETIYVIEGELIAKWKENGEVKTQIVKEGDLIETEHSPHTFINETNKTVKFIVIKQVLTGVNKREVLKNDKVIDQE
ncbi:MAG: cupin domain-containing protein [bacterium]|nr:cupin domain-containing protein [bacterium]